MKQVKRKTTADVLLATQKQILDEINMLKRHQLNEVDKINKRLDAIEKKLDG